MTTWPTVSATGHRPQHLSPAMADWICPELDRVAVKLRDHHGTTVGISGMAIGVDQWWARSVLRAGLALWAYIPCESQPEKWNADQRREWEWLRSRAAQVRVFGASYSVKLLHARNDGMLADSDAVVAVHRPSKRTGGTASAVEKAARRNLPRIHLNPDAQSVHLVYTPPVGASSESTS